LIVITISQKTVIDYDYHMSAYNWPIGLKCIIFILDVKCSWTVVSNQWCVYHSLPVKLPVPGVFLGKMSQVPGNF